jgi:hypothetical protein
MLIGAIPAGQLMRGEDAEDKLRIGQKARQSAVTAARSERKGPAPAIGSRRLARRDYPSMYLLIQSYIRTS